MATRTIRFEDNELYDVIFQILATFPAGACEPAREREATAYAAFSKLAAVGSPREKVGRLQVMTMLEKDGPRDVVLLESEKDIAIEAVRAWQAATFDVPLKDRCLALLANAVSG